jgi:multisubunit Na+/H+ antiporter MnhC subunit
MVFDPTWLLLSLVAGGVGFVLFVYGKRQQRWPQLAAGLLLMVYPYFTPSVIALVITGAVIGVLAWYAVRLGW